MTKTVISIVGARPQFVKAAVVSMAYQRRDDIEEFIIHTGQHYDANMSDIFFEELGIPEPAVNLEIGGGSHGAATGQMMQKLEEEFVARKPDMVVVYGDTNSTLAGSLTAAKMHIPVAHVEAGIRSYNKLMPEEINRILTDHVSDQLYCPTTTAISCLKQEGVTEGVHMVGDVMFDAALLFREHLEPMDDKDFVLCTVHRAENTDDETRLRNIFDGLGRCERRVILPLHPRTQKMLAKFDIKPSTNIECVQPLPYKQMLSLLNNCAVVASDSGGLQKEAYFFGHSCIILRDETEWGELVDADINVLAGTDADKIASSINARFNGTVPSIAEYGDGNASDLIADLVAAY